MALARRPPKSQVVDLVQSKRRESTSSLRDKNTWFRREMAHLQTSAAFWHTVMSAFPAFYVKQDDVPSSPAGTAVERTSDSPKLPLAAISGTSNNESPVAQPSSGASAGSRENGENSRENEDSSILRPLRWGFRHPTTLVEEARMICGLTFRSAKELLSSIMHRMYLS